MYKWNTKALQVFISSSSITYLRLLKIYIFNINDNMELIQLSIRPLTSSCMFLWASFLKIIHIIDWYTITSVGAAYCTSFCHIHSVIYLIGWDYEKSVAIGFGCGFAKSQHSFCLISMMSYAFFNSYVQSNILISSCTLLSQIQEIWQSTICVWT